MSECIEIAQLGAAVLRKIAIEITDFTAKELIEITDDLLCTLANSNGVGLAAPQIGHSLCIIVVASKPTSRYPNAPFMPPVLMLNPHFSPLSMLQKKDWEGCLSIPGIRALVPRYQEIAVDYQDIKGEPMQLRLTGFPARVFQHEYDHLQGMVYLDRVENNRDIIAETEFFKLIANNDEA
jgi:peptide deformylase